MHEYVEAHELVDELSEKDQLNVVQEVRNNSTFPVAMAQSASVIQAVLLEVLYAP